MKKTLLIILAIYATLNVQSQIPKNATLIGGQFSLNSEKSSATGTDMTTKNNSQQFTLSVGKAFKENKVLGISLGYLHSKLSYSLIDTLTNSYNTYNTGIFYRQYLKLANRFYIFGQADAYYFFSKDKRKGYSGIEDFETKGSGGVVSLTPGISYQVLKKLHAELILPNLISMSYSVYKSSNPNTPESYAKKESFAVNTAFTNSATLGLIGIGFRFVL